MEADQVRHGPPPGQPPGITTNNSSSLGGQQQSAYATTTQQGPQRTQQYNVNALPIQSLGVHGGPKMEDTYDVGSIRSGSTSLRYRPNVASIPPPPPKKSWKKRIVDGLKAFVAFVFSKVGICVLVIGYLLIGAVMFQQLEGPEEEKIKFQVGSNRTQLIRKIWKITEQYNTLHPKNWSTEVSHLIQEYQQRIIQEAGKGYDGYDIPSKHAPKWTFTGALLYSITVITTIGYGHIAPITPVGKLVTIFYAIIGIPLFLLYLSNIGDIMAKSFKWTYSRLCKCQRGQKSPEHIPSGILKNKAEYRIQYLPQHLHTGGGVPPSNASSNIVPAPSNNASGQTGGTLEESTSSMASGVPPSEYSDDFQPRVLVGGGGPKVVKLEDVTVPISLCLLVIVAYVVGGALLFSEWENWGMLDGSYFCFITLSTIGFGDMVPGDAISKEEEKATIGGVNNKFVLCSLYIIIGMALIAMCFNLMQEKVIKGVRSLGKRLASKQQTVAVEDQ